MGSEGTGRALVVVADDGGIAAQTDAAIARCVEGGVVRAVSVMVTGATWREAARTFAGLGADVGLHLDLTEGRPLTGGVTCLAPQGAFLGNKHATWAALGERGTSWVNGLTAEVQAQFDALADVVTPVFVNGHNHVHVLPGAREALVAALGETPLHVRRPVSSHAPRRGPEAWPGDLEDACAFLASPPSCWRVPDAFVGHGFARAADLEPVLQVLASVDEGPVEWMVHPGRRPGTGFVASPVRDAEETVLTDPALPERLARAGWRAMGFSEVSRG